MKKANGKYTNGMAHKGHTKAKKVKQKRDVPRCH